MVRLTAAIAALALVVLPYVASASNTGTLRGRVTEAGTGVPIAGATVVANSPSQNATALTDATGSFAFISLAPDTYTVSVTKTGYEPQSQAGVGIFADQSARVDVALVKLLKTIAHTTSRSVQSLVHAGVTSDVYSVNPAGQKAASTLSGSGSLTQAYGAIASAPGVNIPSNQQGWYQGVYVRGGDIDQVAYELDGLPLTRQSDLAPVGTLTSLGSQEVQVYTGGTPATSNSSGLAGYINQVIKAGTFPGYADADLGVGTPAFYHEATVEAGGATPDRLFSYYVGFSGTDQDYRYADQFNGVAYPLYFYPLSIPSSNIQYPILDGSCAVSKPATCSAPSYGAVFSPGAAYAQGTNFDRENVANFHFAIPHHNSGLRDDVQLLYIVGGIRSEYISSANEVWLNSPAARAQGLPYPLSYLDSLDYNGSLMQAPNPHDVAISLFPSSPTDRPVAGPIDVNLRDGNDNDYAIEKLQYQKSFDERSYLRFLAYSEYSDWFINGPDSAQLFFGSDPADYEVLAHISGAGLIYSNQLSSKNLLTAQTTFMTQKLQTYNAMFSSTDATTNSLLPTGLGTVLSSYVGKNGLCYNYTTGAQWSCFDAGSQGGCLLTPYNQGNGGCYPGSAYDFNLTPGSAPPGSPASRAGAHWVVTENGQSAQVDNVTPYFTSYSVADLWQPNDKLIVNLGARLDHFAYATNDLESGYAARQFWFNAYNREHCGALGTYPVWTWNGSGFNACPTGLAPLTNPGNGLYNVGPGFDVSNVFQPRLSFTYTLNPDTVIRGSYGKYARAEASSYYQYNTYQQNLASFIAQFYSYGYHTPDHDISPDTSNNFDLSLEKHIRGTQLSFKVTPFFRDTQNQLEYVAIDPAEGTLAGLNIGTQQSYGVEFSMQYGDFTRNGLSAMFSYTYTGNRVQFAKINGQSVIDTLNSSIQQYNSYTAACAGVTASSPNWQACGAGRDSGNAQPVFANPCGPNCTLHVPNPYYHEALQTLLDPNGWYQPYDVIPSPFNAANGYEVPNVVSLILNYRHGKLAVTPSLHYVDGSFYGSPLVWPGYVPQSCTKLPSTTPLTPGANCPGTTVNGVSTGTIFLPDPYTGTFDNLGALREPSELSLNLQMSYDVSPRVSLELQAVNLYNTCFQRGYAWDNPETCVYSSLASNILPPAGNFVANPPVQLKYPYGTFFNVTEVGISSVTQPFNFFASVNVKL